MRWSYSCPHCRAFLNPGGDVILVASHAGARVLMAFHPEPGNYGASVPPGVTVQAGETWDFSCPLCHTTLTSYTDRALCVLNMHFDDRKHRVYFSRTAGDRATFVVSDDGTMTRHGEHSDRHSLELLEYV